MTIARSTMWWVIIVAGVGTFLLRASFILVAGRLSNLPEGLREGLRMIPPAAFAALVMPALIRPEGAVQWVSPALLAAVFAGLVAWRTRSIAATILIGLSAIMILKQIPFLD